MAPRLVLGLFVALACSSLVVAFDPMDLLNNFEVVQKLKAWKIKGDEFKKCLKDVGFSDCLSGYLATEVAEMWTIQYTNSGAWSQGSWTNGTGDAFRHCAWNALMTRKIGSKNAKIIGDNHEAWAGNPPEEKNMDLANNKYGRAFGESAKSELEAKIACYKAAKAAKLTIISP